jgi:hypothetical protein
LEIEMTRSQLVALFITLGLAVIAVGIILAATSRADSMDDLYVSNLHSQGITSKSGDSSLIAAGHLVCQQRAKGVSGLNIAYAIEDATNLSPFQAGYLVGSAEGAYCPGFYDGPPTGRSPSSTV